MPEQPETVAEIKTDLDIEVMANNGGRCPPGLAARTTKTETPDERPIIESVQSV